MRRITILCLLLLGVLDVLGRSYRPEQIPHVQQSDRRRYVSDPDGILSREAILRIDSICGSLRERGYAQVAVVAVGRIAGDDAFSFAVELFRRWGVGNRRSDNGLGILLVKEMREIRFVTGGGIEGILPDALCKRIQLDYMLPHFRRGDYSTGMVAGVSALAAVLQGGEIDLSQERGGAPSVWMIWCIVLGFLLLPTCALLIRIYCQRHCPKCHRFTLRRTECQILSCSDGSELVQSTFVCSRCGARVKRRERNFRDDHLNRGGGGGMIIGGGPWHGSGGGFGGNFGGGFGGGSFGGGGAGSKW